MYIKPLATLQKKLIRLICNVPPRTHTAPLMQQLKTLNIYNLYTYRTAIEVHKFKYPKTELNRPQHIVNHTYTKEGRKFILLCGIGLGLKTIPNDW